LISSATQASTKVEQSFRAHAFDETAMCVVRPPLTDAAAELAAGEDWLALHDRLIIHSPTVRSSERTTIIMLAHSIKLCNNRYDHHERKLRMRERCVKRGVRNFLLPVNFSGSPKSFEKKGTNDTAKNARAQRGVFTRSCTELIGTCEINANAQTPFAGSHGPNAPILGSSFGSLDSLCSLRAQKH